MGETTLSLAFPLIRTPNMADTNMLGYLKSAEAERSVGAGLTHSRH